MGKTTAAAATALYLLDRARSKESILLFSTDPAHSLSDSLDTDVGNRPVTVSSSRGAKLVAYEMDATAALERFRSEHGPILAEIAERGTLLDESDINELLNLSLPGLDEVMSLFELSELDTKATYDRVIVDTSSFGPYHSAVAPAGSVRTHGECPGSNGRKASIYGCSFRTQASSPR